jgi:hypothetical protein
MHKNRLGAYLFSFPSFFLTMALGIYPVVWALRYMFYDYQGYGTPRFIGLENFARVARDTEFWQSGGQLTQDENKNRGSRANHRAASLGGARLFAVPPAHLSKKSSPHGLADLL